MFLEAQRTIPYYTRLLEPQCPSRPGLLQLTAGAPVSLEARPVIPDASWLHPTAGALVSLETCPAIPDSGSPCPSRPHLLHPTTGCWCPSRLGLLHPTTRAPASLKAWLLCLTAERPSRPGLLHPTARAPVSLEACNANPALEGHKCFSRPACYIRQVEPQCPSTPGLLHQTAGSPVSVEARTATPDGWSPSVPQGPE